MPYSMANATTPLAEEGRAITKGLSWLGQFVIGATFPLRGLKALLTHSALLGLFLLSGLISAAVLLALVVGAVFATTPIVRWITDSDGALFYLVWIAVFVLLLIAAYGLYVVFTAIATGELQDRLSARTEQVCTYENPAGEPGVSFWVGLVDALKSLGGFVLFLLALLLINLIPVLGQAVSLIGGYLLSARSVALEMLKIPMGRRGFIGKTVTRQLNKHRGLWMGFAATASLLVLVPFVNIMGVPAAVVGGTLLYMRLEAAGETPHPGPATHKESP